MSFSSNSPKQCIERIPLSNHHKRSFTTCIWILNLIIKIYTFTAALTSSTIEDTNAAIAAIMYLVPAQLRVAVRLNPDAGHGIVKDLVVLYNTLAAVVDENTSVLPSPDLIAPDNWIAARSEKTHQITLGKNTVRVEQL
jgi:hypothetical protein